MRRECVCRTVVSDCLDVWNTGQIRFMAEEGWGAQLFGEDFTKRPELATVPDVAPGEIKG